MRHAVGVTVEELRRDYRANGKALSDRRELWTYLAVRPVSFYLAALFLRLGMTANQVTWISLVLVVGGAGLLAFGSSALAVGGALAINGWLVLDCTDGTIARYRKSFSPYGEFLDSIGGYAAYGLVFLAAGIGAYGRIEDSWLASLPGGAAIDPGLWLLLGAWASITALWTRLVFQKFRSAFANPSLARHRLLDHPSGGSWGQGLRGAGNNVFNVSGGLLLLLLLATLLGALDLFLLLTAVANTGILIFTVAWLLRRGLAATAAGDRCQDVPATLEAPATAADLTDPV